MVLVVLVYYLNLAMVTENGPVKQEPSVLEATCKGQDWVWLQLCNLERLAW